MGKEMTNTLELTREQIIWYYVEKYAAWKKTWKAKENEPSAIPDGYLTARDKYYIAQGKHEAWTEIINMFNHGGLDKINESQILNAYGDWERREQEKEKEHAEWAASFDSVEEYAIAELTDTGGRPPRVAPGEIDGMDVFVGREKLTVEEFSQRFNLKKRAVQQMITDKRIPAEKIKNKWWIPGDVQPPKDRRIKHGRYVQPKR